MIGRPRSRWRDSASRSPRNGTASQPISPVARASSVVGMPVPSSFTWCAKRSAGTASSPQYASVMATAAPPHSASVCLT